MVVQRACLALIAQGGRWAPARTDLVRCLEQPPNLLELILVGGCHPDRAAGGELCVQTGAV
jgi:hypothetical protein